MLLMLTGPLKDSPDSAQLTFGADNYLGGYAGSCSEKAMATHSRTLAWKIPWAKEPGRLQSMGSLRVGHDWATSLSLFTCLHWRRKWQPTPVFLPGESQGWRSLVGCRLWGRTRVRHDWSNLAAAAAGELLGEEAVLVTFKKFSSMLGFYPLDTNSTSLSLFN